MTVDSPSQREHARQAEHRAVNTCCAAWPWARLDAEARGFPTPGDGPTGRGGHADPTPTIAATPDISTWWLLELHDLVVVFTTGLLAGHTSVRWGVDTDPAYDAEIMLWQDETQVKRLWNLGVDQHVNRWPAQPQLAKRLYHLADMAAIHWPPKPRKGQTIDGVTIGARTNTADQLCAYCQCPVTDLDPGQRLGREDILHTTLGPGHGACYDTVWRSRRGKTGKTGHAT